MDVVKPKIVQFRDTNAAVSLCGYILVGKPVFGLWLAVAVTGPPTLHRYHTPSIAFRYVVNQCLDFALLSVKLEACVRDPSGHRHFS